MDTNTRENLVAKLADGDRREVGRAGEVALEVLDNPAIIPDLLACLRSDDEAVISHAAHAIMQIGQSRVELFQDFADQLIDALTIRTTWEVGEQLPKILAELNLTNPQTESLVPVLVDQINDRSAIASVCALTALVRLSERQMFDKAKADELVAEATTSPRKAVAARARRLMGKP